MKYTASMSNSKAWKSTRLYRTMDTNFEPEEYILADKAYALERHIITPFKNPTARQPIDATFNYELSKPRVKIKHAFGILKARWPTLNELPLRIGLNEKRGHQRVHYWTMACLVLHNLLHSMRDDETWLEEEIEREQAAAAAAGNQDIDGDYEQESYHDTEAQRVGATHRDELRNLVASLQDRVP